MNIYQVMEAVTPEYEAYIKARDAFEEAESNYRFAIAQAVNRVNPSIKYGERKWGAYA